MRTGSRVAHIPLALAAALVVLTQPARAFAHDPDITDVHVLLRADGHFQADITCDVDALALGAKRTAQEPAALAMRLRTMSPEEFDRCIQQLEAVFHQRVRIRFDGRDADFDVSFPSPGAILHSGEIPTVLGDKARLTGSVPPDADAMTFWAGPAFLTVHLSMQHEGSERVTRHVLEIAQESPPFPLKAPAPLTSRGEVAWRYLRLGYEHIVPDGLDHILFVLGLFLLGSRLRPLLWQITAFTVAHSVTLALAMYGVISLSPRIVEPLIALSIAYVAIENIVTGQLKPWRPAVVFVFGLLHGLGFAGVLSELGLPREEFATALITFNVGVELGQFSVVLLAFLAVGWFRGRPWYRRRIVVPASVAIAAVGLYWAIERVFG